MSPERWARVKEVLDSALELNPNERDGYLAIACAEDSSLRSEVESLLHAQERSPDSFMKTGGVPSYLPRGTKLDEYEIIELIGAGGMGEVYRARDLQLKRDVAIKVLPPTFALDRERLRRFELEACATAALNHPNILAIHSLGRHEEQSYIVSELLQGHTLREELKSGALPLRKAIDYGLQIARGLATAHEKGIVHRDIKPENIFVTNDRQIKLLDFGLAKLKIPALEQETRTSPDTDAGTILGTLAYMSPEQVRGQPVDQRTDIFALGAILYEMFSGRRTCIGMSSADVISEILNQEPPKIPTERNVPATIERVVHHCLEKNPDRRFQSATDLVFALETASTFADSGLGLSGTEATQASLRLKWLRIGIVTVLTVGAGVGLGVYSLVSSWRPVGFRTFSVMQVTNSGKAELTAVSPDGRYTLSVINDNGSQSLWLHNVPTSSDTQVIAPSPARYQSVTFSPDGNYFYFQKAADSTNSVFYLYRAPVLGGSTQTVIRDVDSDIAFSPDGLRIGFARGSAEEGKYRLLSANLDGTDEKVLHVASLADIPTNLAWSPNAREIAYCLRRPVDALGEIDLLNIETEKIRRFATFDDKSIVDLKWLPQRSGVLVAYQQKGINFERRQIGLIAGSGSHFEPVTRDTDNYASLSLSADGKTLAAIQTKATGSLDLLSGDGKEALQPDLVISREQHVKSFDWDADRNLIISDGTKLSRIGSREDLKTRLLGDPNSTISELSSCGSRYIVFSWALHKSSNSINIWRANADGTDLQRLTSGKEDRVPFCSSEENRVYYFNSERMQIWNVPLTGGGTAEIVRNSAIPHTLVTGGGFDLLAAKKLLAYTVATTVTAENPQSECKIVLLNLTATSVSRMMSVEQHGLCGEVKFTPDGEALAYLVQDNGVDNLWRQSLDNSPGRLMTKFDTGKIADFRWSPDGKMLALTRSRSESDVVLLLDAQQ